MYKASAKKGSNRNRILESIFRNPAISRTEIAALTGITPATTTQTIARLMEEGVVQELGEDSSDASGAGRKRISLGIVPDYRYALGIEFNQTCLCTLITDLCGTVIYEHKLPYEPALRKHITEIILAEIADALRSAALTQEQLVGIGIAVPGHMDEAASRVISNHNVWQRFDASLIRAHYKLPIVLENNARCMALARYLFHPAQTPDSFALFHVGLGMFCANLVDGNLFLGNTYVSGEIGHTIVNPNGVRCECGKQGCLQTIASERWLIQNVRKLYELNASPLLRLLADTPDDISIDTIANAYDLGDEAVTVYVTNAMRYLGIATSNIAILMNPEKIFLHGKLFAYPNIRKELLDVFRNQLSFVGSDTAGNIEILPCSAADGAIGGCALAILESFLEVSYS